MAKNKQPLPQGSPRIHADSFKERQAWIRANKTPAHHLRMWTQGNLSGSTSWCAEIWDRKPKVKKLTATIPG